MNQEGETGERPRDSAREADVQAAESRLGGRFPAPYRAFLHRSDGHQSHDRIVLYALHELDERNETFNVMEFFPNYFAVGDDSGGRLVLLRKGDESAQPWLVGAGALMPDDGRAMGTSWEQWEAAGFPLHRSK